MAPNKTPPPARLLSMGLLPTLYPNLACNSQSLYQRLVTLCPPHLSSMCGKQSLSWSVALVARLNAPMNLCEALIGHGFSLHPVQVDSILGLARNGTPGPFGTRGAREPKSKPASLSMACGSRCFPAQGSEGKPRFKLLTVGKSTPKQMKKGSNRDSRRIGSQ